MVCLSTHSSMNLCMILQWTGVKKKVCVCVCEIYIHSPPLNVCLLWERRHSSGSNDELDDAAGANFLLVAGPGISAVRFCPSHLPLCIFLIFVIFVVVFQDNVLSPAFPE